MDPAQTEESNERGENSRRRLRCKRRQGQQRHGGESCSMSIFCLLYMGRGRRSSSCDSIKCFERQLGCGYFEGGARSLFAFLPRGGGWHRGRLRGVASASATAATAETSTPCSTAQLANCQRHFFWRWASKRRQPLRTESRSPGRRRSALGPDSARLTAEIPRTLQ